MTCISCFQPEVRPHHSTVVQSISLPDDPLPVPTESVQPEVNQTCKEEMSSETRGGREGKREGGGGIRSVYTREDSVLRRNRCRNACITLRN